MLVCRRDLAAFWGAVGPGGSLLSFHTAPGGTPLPGSSLWCASPWSHGHPPPAPPKLGRQQRALAWALTPPPRPPHPGAGAGAQAPSCARQFPSEAEGRSGTCLLLCAFVRQGERTSPGAARRVLCNPHSPAPAPHTPSQPDTLPVELAFPFQKHFSSGWAEWKQPSWFLCGRAASSWNARVGFSSP